LPPEKTRNLSEGTPWGFVGSPVSDKPVWSGGGLRHRSTSTPCRKTPMGKSACGACKRTARRSTSAFHVEPAYTASKKRMRDTSAGVRVGSSEKSTPILRVPV
jgi:hypothetical protein